MLYRWLGPQSEELERFLITLGAIRAVGFRPAVTASAPTKPASDSSAGRRSTRSAPGSRPRPAFTRSARSAVPVAIGPISRTSTVCSVLTIMPGERADVIVDFAAAAGQTLHPPQPRPDAVSRTARRRTASTLGQILQMQVAAPLGPTDAQLRPLVGNAAAAADDPRSTTRPPTGTLAACVSVGARRGSSTLNERHRSPGGRSRCSSTTPSGRDARAPDFTQRSAPAAGSRSFPEEGTTERLGDRQPDRGRPPDPHPPDAVPGAQPSGVQHEPLRGARTTRPSPAAPTCRPTGRRSTTGRATRARSAATPTSCRSCRGRARPRRRTRPAWNGHRDHVPRAR